MAVVEVEELCVGELWDFFRVSARVDAVRSDVREQTLLGVASHQALGAGVDALHFVVHDSFVFQGRIHTVQLEVPALLA